MMDLLLTILYKSQISKALFDRFCLFSSRTSLRVDERYARGIMVAVRVAHAPTLEALYVLHIMLVESV